jgi:hypothetical protein
MCRARRRTQLRPAAPQRRLFDSHCHIIDRRFPIVIFEEG